MRTAVQRAAVCKTGKQVAQPQVDASSEEIVREEAMPDGSQRGSIPLMPLVIIAAQAMRKNTPKTIAVITGGEYEPFKSMPALNRARRNLPIICTTATC